MVRLSIIFRQIFSREYRIRKRKCIEAVKQLHDQSYIDIHTKDILKYITEMEPGDQAEFPSRAVFDTFMNKYTETLPAETEKMAQAWMLAAYNFILMYRIGTNTMIEPRGDKDYVTINNKTI